MDKTFWFETRDTNDSWETILENPNRISGQALGGMIRDALLAAGWQQTDDGAVDPEDWGWYFFIRWDGHLCMVGVHQINQVEEEADFQTYCTTDWQEGGAFVELYDERKFWDKLLGRNKPSPESQKEIEKQFQKVLSSMQNLRNLHAEPSL